MKVNLLVRILIAIAVGIVLGFFLWTDVIRLFVTFNHLFSEFLGFIIPLLIIGLVAPSIAEMNRKAGRILLITLSIAYIATIFSGLFSYMISEFVFPLIVEKSGTWQVEAIGSGMQPYFEISVPPIMSVMSSLVFAFILGLGIASLPGDNLRNGICEFRTIIHSIISKVIIPLLPLYIMGVFMEITCSGQIINILATFIKIIGVIFVIHILVLLIQFVVAGVVARRNPFVLLRGMLPAYFTALGTQSSAATIPVTLAQCIKNGVRREVANFVVPLCATIHLSGSTLKIVSCAIALMIMANMECDFSMMLNFICMLGIVMIAAPGVPGGAIMAALSVLHSILGFGEGEQALMIALYITMDNFGTACNVTGDGAIAVLVDSMVEEDSGEFETEVKGGRETN